MQKRQSTVSGVSRSVSSRESFAYQQAAKRRSASIEDVRRVRRQSSKVVTQTKAKEVTSPVKAFSDVLPTSNSVEVKEPVATVISTSKKIEPDSSIQKVLAMERDAKDITENSDEKKPKSQSVAEHIAELRVRLLRSVAALIVGGTIGYFLQDQIIKFLVQPLGQKIFYTSPTGGFDFLIKTCLFFGFFVALPVMIHQTIGFLSPAFEKSMTRVKIFKTISASTFLALLGASFAYFVSLPAALHFLNNFSNDQISSIISAREYVTFVMIYIAGFALLFQVPLVMSIVHNVVPLNPKTLMKKLKIVILVSFIVAAILTPTPDPINQMLMALPIIVLYQFSVIVVWWKNYIKNRTMNSVKISY